MKDEILKRNLRAMRGITGIGEKVTAQVVQSIKSAERKEKNKSMFDPVTIAKVLVQESDLDSLER